MVKIRLSRVGGSNQRKFRIVVADSQKAAQGRFLEVLGTLDQTVKPQNLVLNREKYQAWLGKGAKPSETVFKLVTENSK